MNWREDLHRVSLGDGRRMIGASFRGVPFFVESADRSGGRRIVAHEFPLRDDPYVEDLGRRARVFTVEGYVLGKDYVRRRDELLAALEDTEGPGELVHPYHGVLRAICSSLSIRESVADGGLARFAIEFTETPAQFVEVTAQADVAEQVWFAADDALGATRTTLEDGYGVDGLPAFALASASATLTTMAGALGSALAPVVKVTQELARLDVDIKRLTNQATTLIRTPGGVLTAFLDTIASLEQTVTSSPKAVLDALVDAYNVDLVALIPDTTAVRQRERANQTALAAALRRVLAIEAARLATRVEFESHEDAIAARNEIAGLLEEEAEGADDATYASLVDLRSKLLRAVPGDAVLANLQTVERRTAVPSLLLAYQLYGSVEKEADILARNRVRHPGFVSGELQVLSDV